MILDDFGDFWCPTEMDAGSMPPSVVTTILFEVILAVKRKVIYVMR